MRRRTSIAAVIVLALVAQACDAATLAKAENRMNQAANGLNAAAKTNHRLYQANVINLANRREVARVINFANSKLDAAIDRAYAIQPGDAGSLSTGKIDVAKILREATEEIGKLNIGNEELRLALQAVIALINEANSIFQRVKEIT